MTAMLPGVSTAAATDEERLRFLETVWQTMAERLENWPLDGMSIRLERHGRPVSLMQVDVAATVTGPDDGPLGQFHGFLVPGPQLADSWIVLNHIHLRPEARGGNFARRLLDQIEAALADLGLRRLSVHAFAAGAYLWADRGFSFDCPPHHTAAAARAVIDRAAANGVIAPIRSDPALAPHLRELLERITDQDGPAACDSPLTAPGHFIDFIAHADDDIRMHRRNIIRQILGGSSWRGTKQI